MSLNFYYSLVPDRLFESIILSPQGESVKRTALILLKLLYGFNLPTVTLSDVELEALGIKQGMVGVAIHAIEKTGWFTFKCHRESDLKTVITCIKTEVSKYYNDQVPLIQNTLLIEIGLRGKKHAKNGNNERPEQPEPQNQEADRGTSADERIPAKPRGKTNARHRNLSKSKSKV